MKMSRDNDHLLNLSMTPITNICGEYKKGFKADKCRDKASTDAAING